MATSHGQRVQFELPTVDFSNFKYGPCGLPLPWVSGQARAGTTLPFAFPLHLLVALALCEYSV